MHIFFISPKLQITQVLLNWWWLNQLWYIYVVEYYSPIQRNGLLLYSTAMVYCKTVVNFSQSTISQSSMKMGVGRNNCKRWHALWFYSCDILETSVGEQDSGRPKVFGVESRRRVEGGLFLTSSMGDPWWWGLLFLDCTVSVLAGMWTKLWICKMLPVGAHESSALFLKTTCESTIP